jgi:translation initiation factor IF-2
VSKIRVYELSKQLGLTNQAVINMLQTDYGVEVKSHSSTVENDVAAKIVAKHTPAKTSANPAPVATPAIEDKTQAPVSSATPPIVSSAQQAKAPQQHHGFPAQHSSLQPQRPTRPGGQPGTNPVRSQPGHHSGNQRSQQSSAPITVRPGGAPVKPGSSPSRPGHPQQVAVLDKQPLRTAGNTTAQPVQQAGHRSPQQVQQQPASPQRPSMSPQAGQPQRPQQPNIRPGGRPGGRPGNQQRGNAARQDSRQDTRQERRDLRQQEPEPAKPVDINEDLTVAELALALKLRETDIIKHLFMKGLMVTVNQNVEVGFARTIAEEMGFELTEQVFKADSRLEQVADVLDKKPKLDAAQFKHLKERAPVVSIMGHVDHGKTSLLDAIREAKRNIVDTEAGGITQRIGAYSVEKDGRHIVFLDTPGHEAFTTMRMRGAKSTDIAILVVAADDGVMPQTIEAISHAKAAEIPIIVAINKIDKEGADPDRVLAGLSDHGLVSEKWGGDVITVEVSALQQLGIDDLLEMILLVTELLELKADSTVAATGVIVEAKLDKRKGPVATALVQNGTLKVGDNVLIGSVGGRVRALLNDRSDRVQQAGPSTPVEILGLSEVPAAGDLFEVIRDDRRFKQELSARKVADKEARQSVNQARQVGMVARGEDEEGPKFVHLVIKADTQGSVEAVTNSLLQLDQSRVQLKILHAGTGDVSEADVSLASASGGTVVAFNVRHEGNALKLSESNGVEVLPFDVIYHVTETIEKRMKGELAPETREIEVGQIEVRQLFTVGKNVVIAGCYVTKGKAIRNAKAVVNRGKQVMFTGVLDNLKRFKDDAKEVAQGYECGISFDKFNDLAIGDVITVFTEEVINPV